jgi:hypothetical protein
VTGCTLNTPLYNGVASDTPRYNGIEVAIPHDNDRTTGQLNWGFRVHANYSATINFNAQANVLAGCMIAVEGCMDPTAVNYNSQATINSGSWCVPAVSGCMMPSWGSISDGTAVASGRSNTKEGGAANFASVSTHAPAPHNPPPPTL